jgi:hypothetical protein
LTNPASPDGGARRCAHREPRSVSRRVHLRRRLQPGDGDHHDRTGVQLEWKCIGGHDPWSDNTFRFQLAPLDDGRTRLRFWQDYARELSDDAFGVYNFNWGYYLESLRLLCTTGAGKPFDPER